MEFIFLALIFYFFIGAAVCLLICVNPNDPGILGRMSNMLFKKFPPLFKYHHHNPAHSYQESSANACCRALEVSRRI